MKKPNRKRLDLLLVERGLAETRQKATAMILAGEVSVDNTRVDKAGAAIPETANSRRPTARCSKRHRNLHVLRWIGIANTARELPLEALPAGY